MNTIIIASTNKKKKAEIKHLLSGLRFNVLTVDETKQKIPKVIENGRTFEANAAKKAIAYSKALKAVVVADDSGLMVDVLCGKPGVMSARFSGKGAADEKNNAKLLDLLEGLPASRRGSQFVCVIAVANKGKLITTVRGVCRGRIEEKPKGHNGFGYDPLFIPNGYKKTFAEISMALKGRISHRGKALRELKAYLNKVKSQN